MLNKKKNNKGFTLVELLVVIAIIGILAVVAVPALFSNIEKSKVSKLEGNISAIKSAALSYYADESEFYTTSSAMTAEELSDTSKSDLADYLEDLKTVFKGETYEIEGTTNEGNGSTLTIEFTESLGEKSQEKLANDLGLTTGVTSTGVTVTIINKK